MPQTQHNPIVGSMYRHQILIIGRAITYGGGKFVAVADFGDANKIM